VEKAGLDVIIRYVQSSKKKTGRNQMVQPAMQMHVLADDLCKRAPECRDQKDYFNFPANKVNLVLNDHTINANVSKATMIAYQSISLRNYMKQKHNWTNLQIDKIWWKPLHRSTSTLTNNDLVKIQKFMYNYLPTNKRKNMNHNNHSELCEVCKLHTEDENHIMKCESEKREDIREQWIEDLETMLSKPHTPREVKECIIACITNWIKNEQLPEVNAIPVSLRTVFREQMLIGWDQFIRGRITMSWSEIINNHLEERKIKNINAEQWGTDLLSINWRFVIRMWNQRNQEVLGSTETEKEERRK
jgi:hypothetical protein